MVHFVFMHILFWREDKHVQKSHNIYFITKSLHFIVYLKCYCFKLNETTNINVLVSVLF